MKKLSILFAAMLIPLFAVSQKSLKELADEDEKKFQKLLSIKGTPLADQLKMLAKQDKITESDLNPIKRVGLISVFIADFSEVKSNTVKGYGYSVTTTSYRNLSEAGAGAMVDVFFNNSIPLIRQEFQQRQMELLLPSEFANTPESSEVYQNYEMDISKVIDKLGNLGYLGLGDLFYPKDFRMIWATKADGLDTKQQRSLGKLAKDLGLDAIIAIEVATQIDGKEVKFKGIGTTMYGPNPEKYDPDAKYPGIMGAAGYWEGRNFGYARMNLGKGLPICKLKKKEIVEDYSDGGGQVVSRVVMSLVDMVNKNMVWPD